MLLAFLYCADVARNEGGCNELVGTFMNVDDALEHCLSLIETDKYKHMQATSPTVSTLRG